MSDLRITAAAIFAFNAGHIDVFHGEPCFGCLTPSGRDAWISFNPRRVMACADHLAKIRAWTPPTKAPPQ